MEFLLYTILVIVSMTFGGLIGIAKALSDIEKKLK